MSYLTVWTSRADVSYCKPVGKEARESNSQIQSPSIVPELFFFFFFLLTILENSGPQCTPQQPLFLLWGKAWCPYSWSVGQSPVDCSRMARTMTSTIAGGMSSRWLAFFHSWPSLSPEGFLLDLARYLPIFWAGSLPPILNVYVKGQT